ncbi:MAG: cysteine desulfurase [Deltaproteobacteria bacterium]|nr:cysteine desulfurase [Deltaproteobacteria bacterium]
MDEVYLDNAATTRPWPEVIDAVSRAMGDGFGNASSLHSRGLAAARAVTGACDAIEEVVGSGPWRVVFTSGGTEADAMAVLGSAPRGKRDTVVTTTVEHAAVTEACRQVVDRGGRLVEVEAGLSGVIDPDAVGDAVDEKTALVSVVHVANEIGTVQPVADMARIVKAKAPGCRIHVDAVQALAQIDALDYPPEVDMVSISAHKIHGPQGIGALLLRKDVRPRPLVFGGDQQEGLRPGTFNLPGIAGFSTAIGMLDSHRKDGIARMNTLSERLIREIMSGMEGVRQLGDSACRAPGMVVLAIEGVTSEVLLHTLEARGVLAASGSACHSTRKQPPRCLRDAGLETNEGAVRLSLSSQTTSTEIDVAVDVIAEAIDAVRTGRMGS